MKKGNIYILLSALFLIVCVLMNFHYIMPAQADKSYQTTFNMKKEKQDDFSAEDIEKQKVIKVIDGDSIILENGREVRYIGIDAPEISYYDCFSQQATEKNKQLVLNKEVFLMQDVSLTDEQGRYLAYVYVDGLFVNEYLVENGFAFALSWKPDIKYANEFAEHQRKAKYEGRGLWGACYNK